MFRITLRELLLATALLALALAWFADHRSRLAPMDDLDMAVHLEEVSASFCVNDEERAAMERQYHVRTGRWPARLTLSAAPAVLVVP